ncbi:Hypothetical protein, putative [Bodo saltans]|uniref:Uncharacterized protein n=1 Tax=Bodo saltans TaxID=75058 RepID=A0A0S4JPL0_BODSA|nr:Hypothetical protein, putative [Bodo saltans]|eukprot:CUG92119.1 Hypothetical protein, putative [Bodo saltans]
MPTWDTSEDVRDNDITVGTSPVAVDIHAMLRRESTASHYSPADLAASSSRRSFDHSAKEIIPDLNAPPSCMPATHVAGSDTLVLRSGVMMWDDTQQVVGKRAGDVRMKFLDKQRVTPDDSWLQIRMVL